MTISNPRYIITSQVSIAVPIRVSPTLGPFSLPESEIWIGFKPTELRSSATFLYRKMASGKRLRVAIFDTDIPVPKVRAVRGLYSDIFEGLLHTAASTLPEYKGVALEFEAYDIVKGALPTEEELQKLNGIIITGSGMYRPLNSGCQSSN